MFRRTMAMLTDQFHEGALYGIVQALLVTKHLLFVGYSLSDEDFHELADEIRTALEPTAAERTQLGTVLTIEESAWGRLWKTCSTWCEWVRDHRQGRPDACKSSSTSWHTPHNPATRLPSQPVLRGSAQRRGEANRQES
jgi:SIR2-like domain